MDWQEKQRRFNVLIINGNQAFEKEDYDIALKIFLEAIKLNPSSKPQIIPKILKCYRKKITYMKNKEDYDGIINIVHEMEKLDSSLSNMKGIDYKNLGIAYFHKNQYDKAKECFDNALRLKPDIKEIDIYLNKIKTEEVYNKFQELNKKEMDKKKKSFWRKNGRIY